MAVGVPSEVLQQSLERHAAKLDLTSEEAMTEYLDTAIASAAALAPMGSMSALPSTIKAGKSKRKPEDIQKMLKEDIENAPEPKFRTPEEARPALESAGLNPDIFTPEASVKAANVLIERTDRNRMDFLEKYVPEIRGLDLMQSTTSLTSITDRINTKKPLDNMVLESLSPDAAEMQTLAQAIPARDFDSIPKPPKMDFKASTGLLNESAAITQQYRRERFMQPQIDTEINTAGGGRFILEPSENFAKTMRDLSKLRKDKLIEVATQVYGIDPSKLKDKTGKFFKKEPSRKSKQGLVEDNEPNLIETIGSEIMEKKPEVLRARQLDPPPQTPVEGTLDKIDMNTFEKISLDGKALKPRPTAVPKVKKLSESLKRIGKESGFKINIDKDLTVSQETNKFTKPVRAAQAHNFIFTAKNFLDTKSYPDLKTNFMEVWNYVFENFSDNKQKKLLDQITEKFDAIDPDNHLGDAQIKYLMSTEAGKRGFGAHFR